MNDWNNALESEVKFICGQEEIGKEGTKHFQGYIELNKPMRIGGVKKIPGFERAHLEVRKGTQTQAIDYCQKKDSTTIEGTF